MFSKNLFTLALLILCTVTFASAQQPTQTPPDGSTQQERRDRLRERHKERRKGHQRMREHGMRGLIRGLDLTDAQREQLKAIADRRLESTKLQREELLQLQEKRRAGTFSEADAARVTALREQVRASMEGIRAEAEAILTAEQKLQLQQRELERKARHE